MYVCICNAITDGDIRQAASRGATSIEDLGAELELGRCCGRCKDCARKHLNQAVSEQGAIAVQGRR